MHSYNLIAEDFMIQVELSSLEVSRKTNGIYMVIIPTAILKLFKIQ